MPKISDVDIEGKKLSVIVREDGVFQIDIGGSQWVEADTMGKVVAKARLALRRQRAAIPVTLVVTSGYSNQGVTFRDGVVVGRHASNNALLFRSDKTGRTEQIHEYEHKPCRVLEESQRNHLQALHTARVQAAEAFVTYLKSLQMNVTEALAKTDAADAAAGKEPTEA